MLSLVLHNFTRIYLKLLTVIFNQARPVIIYEGQDSIKLPHSNIMCTVHSKLANQKSKYTRNGDLLLLCWTTCCCVKSYFLPRA